MVNLGPSARAYDGHVLGLQQGSVHLTLTIESPSPDALAAAERYFSGCLGQHVAEGAWAQSEGDDLAMRLAGRIADWTAALQHQVHIPVSRTFFLRPMRRAERGMTVYVALPCTHKALLLRALRWVIGAMRDVAQGRTSPGDGALDRLLEELRGGSEPGTNTFHIAQAAYRLGMPVRRPLSGAPMQRALLIGTGCRGRWLDSTMTDRTSALGVRLAGDKASTARLLREVGLPGATHEFAASAQEAIAVAERLGYPVVIKPADRDQGLGVAADLRTQGEVESAFENARRHSRAILVERHCNGATHRLSVANGQLVKVVKRLAGGVTGDGVHTIAELVSRSESDPQRRQRRTRTGQTVLSLDEEAQALLARADLGPDSIPDAGVHVRLRRRDNVNAGGTNQLIPLDQVHPDNRALALRVAELMRLDIAGIDLILEDIGRSWLAQQALICEVNAQPQMGVLGAEDLYCELLRDLFVNGGRVPVALALLSEAQPVDDTLRERVRRWSQARTLAHAGGVFLEGQRISGAFPSGYAAGAAALTLPQTESLLLVMTVDDVLRHGLPVDRVDRIGLVEAGSGSPDTRRLRDQALMLLGPCSAVLEHW